MADFRHYFPVDDPDVTWYDWNHLELQVEREGYNGLTNITNTCKIGCRPHYFMGHI